MHQASLLMSKTLPNATVPSHEHYLKLTDIKLNDGSRGGVRGNKSFLYLVLKWRLAPDSKTLVGHRWLWVAKYSLWATTEPLVAH